MATLSEDPGKRGKVAKKRAQTKPALDQGDRDSPDRPILTPEGCRRLIGIGEKALPLLMQRGLPYVALGNSYRYDWR
jgi:hypothetical protein